MTDLKSEPPRPRQRTHQPGYPTKLAFSAGVVALATACGGAVEPGADGTGNQLLGDQDKTESTPQKRSENDTGGRAGAGGYGGAYGNEGGGASPDNWEEEPEDPDPNTGDSGGTGGTGGTSNASGGADAD